MTKWSEEAKKRAWPVKRRIATHKQAIKQHQEGTLNTPKQRVAVRKGMKKWWTPERRAVWRERIIKRNQDPEFQIKLNTPGHRAMLRELTEQRWQVPECHIAQREVMKKLNEEGKTNTPEQRAKASKDMAERQRDPEFRAAMWAAQGRHPNKPELWLIAFFQKYDLSFKYTGDGCSETVGTLVPDFIHTDKTKKQLIEYNGDYWHTIRSGAREHDRGKLRIYRKAGYKVLTLWSHHLKDEEALLKKIKRFERR